MFLVLHLDVSVMTLSLSHNVGPQPAKLLLHNASLLVNPVCSVQY